MEVIMNERIRFGTPVEFPVPLEELPSKSLTSQGDIDQDTPFQVYIVEDIYKQIWQHVISSPQVECGGILVGYPFKTFDQSITFVVITGAIPQSSSNRGIAHFTVGPEEVAAARTLLEQTFPGLIAVGWYHSHPGHGVFLSEQDMVIVRSIYNSSWHLALVVDPQRRETAFFSGPEGVRMPKWNVLSRQPEIVHVMALYNRVKAWIESGNPEKTQQLTKQIEILVNNNPELQHWKQRGGYRDLEINVATPRGLSTPHKIPHPSRREESLSDNRQSLFSIFIPTLLFGMLMMLAAVLISDPLVLLTLGWGAFISLIASYAAIQLIASQRRVNTGERYQTPDYKLVGIVIIISVWLIWLLVTALVLLVST
jgi:proteasome lid subunit RPN8/RPN11